MSDPASQNHTNGESTQLLEAPHGPVTIQRDRYGIPSIETGNTDDAWWAMGYAAASDRLWQLEYDRRRASGRWSEAAGRTGLDADILARRLRLDDAARADIGVMDDVTLASFTSYSAGINHAATTQPLPPEYALCGIGFEPWEAWHSIAAFKIRHLLMGSWQYKLLRAILLATEGVDAFHALDPISREGMRYTTPSGAKQLADITAARDLWENSYGDIARAAEELGFLSEVEAGSNAWVVSGSLSETGSPVLSNDSHRAADVPNVYWQARVSCPEFTVTGATFPGIPGFPHFGHNGHVGWAITNAAADAQDLLLEEFRGTAGSLESRTPSGWQPVDERTETIRIRPDAAAAPAGRDAHTVAVQTYSTASGPVVHGDPLSSRALSLRWSATDEPCAQFGVLKNMLTARSVDELFDGQKPWVDPINNLLTADTAGNIGYLLRGALPDRRDTAAAQLPLPASSEQSLWDGRIAFERMPRQTNPLNGYLANANNTVSDPGGLLITHTVNDFLRIERIAELLDGSGTHSVADLAGYQNDAVSIAARLWSGYLDGLSFDAGAERARAMLAGWDGDLAGSPSSAFLYAHFRRELVALALPRVVSRATASRMIAGGLPSSLVMIKRWTSQLAWSIHLTGAPGDPVDDDLLGRALGAAFASASALGGPDPAAWNWGEHHRLTPRHTLSGTDLAGHLRDPVGAAATGDADTIQNAAYGWLPGSPFSVTNTAVYRQVLDLADLPSSRWAIPGGASADPRSAHYDDQMELWGAGRLAPMLHNGPAGAPVGTDALTAAAMSHGGITNVTK